MQRRHIKHNFAESPHVVKPLQNVFHEECDEANLNTDALPIFSGLQKQLVEEMMDGACALSQGRRSDVAAEDLCHLNTKSKVDPLLISDNCYRAGEITKRIGVSDSDTQRKVDALLISDKCYRAKETTKKLPLPTKPLPRPRRQRSSNTKKTTAKVKKISAKKLKEMEAHKRTMDICRAVVFKLPFPPPLKKKPEPELKAKSQTSNDIMSRPDIIEFFGNKYKRYSFAAPNPSPMAPTCKSNSNIEKKTSICERLIKNHPSKKQTELEFKVPKPQPESLTFKTYGIKQHVSDAVSEQFPKTSTYEPKLEVGEKMSIEDHSIKVFPFKEKTEHEIKVASSCQDKMLDKLPGVKLKQEVCDVDTVLKLSPEAPTCKPKSKPQPKSLTFKTYGMKQHVSDAVSEQFPKTSIYEPKLEVGEKMPIDDHSIKVFPFKEKTEHEIKVESSCQDKMLDRLPGVKLKQEVCDVDTVLKLSPEAPTCKPKSKVEKKSSSCEHLIKVFPSKGKTELEYKVSKQRSVETQVVKIPDKKGKQELPTINCTSVETSVVERQPSNEIPCLDSQVPKIPVEKRKREVFDINGAPVETPEVARKRLAIILLKIAGRY